MKKYKVVKKMESKPTMMGMAMTPFFITTGTFIMGVIYAISSKSFISTLLTLVIWLTIMVLSNYIYNSRILDRMGDAQQPKRVHNDLY